MNRLRLWILGVSLGCFGVGVNVGLATPRLFAAAAAPTPDDNYIRAFTAEYGLTEAQQRLLRFARQKMREERIALIGTIELDLLPPTVQHRLRDVGRRLEQRIRVILDEEQRARYDLASRQDRSAPADESGTAGR